MDTITIESVQVGVPSVSYTSNEVIRFIQKAKDYDRIESNLTDAYKTSRDIREKVRDFFSEGEWNDDGDEFTASKSDINDLLEAIGTYKLTSTYGGTFTISGTFTVEASDAVEASDMFRDNVSIDFSDGDFILDDVVTEDVSENY